MMSGVTIQEMYGKKYSFTHDVDIVRRFVETAVCAAECRECIQYVDVKINDNGYVVISINVPEENGHVGLKYNREFSSYGDAGYDLNDIVDSVMHIVADKLTDTSEWTGRDFTLTMEQREIVNDYLINIPANKMLVFETDDHEYRTLFIKWDTRMQRFHSIVRYFSWHEMGAGPQSEFNVPISIGSMMYLDEMYRSERIDGHSRTVKVSCLDTIDYDDRLGYDDNWGKYYHRGEMMLRNYEIYMIFKFANVTDVKLIDCDDNERFNHVTSKYMIANHPEETEDISDDDGSIAKEYEDCRAYNPEAFAHWKDYFCRKRCMIDSGAGCGSNCCKARVTEFVRFQYEDYEIEDVRAKS